MGIQGSENSNIGLKVDDRLERSQGLDAQEDRCLPTLQGMDSEFTWLPVGLHADLGRAEAAVLGGIPEGESRGLLRGEALQTTGAIPLPVFLQHCFEGPDTANCLGGASIDHCHAGCHCLAGRQSILGPCGGPCMEALLHGIAHEVVDVAMVAIMEEDVLGRVCVTHEGCLLWLAARNCPGPGEPELREARLRLACGDNLPPGGLVSRISSNPGCYHLWACGS